jgi:hypothetical protein
MSVTDITSIDVGERPQTWMGLVTATVLSVLWVVAIRIALVALINDPVHPITYVGVIGGIVGAAAMQGVIRWRELGYSPATHLWSKYVADGEPPEFVRQGVYLNLLYGAIAGGVYPRLFHTLGFGGGLFAALPGSLLTGLAFGVLAFVVAMALAVVGLLDMDVDAKRIGMVLSLHLLYGVVLGFVVGVWPRF